MPCFVEAREHMNALPDKRIPMFNRLAAAMSGGLFAVSGRRSGIGRGRVSKPPVGPAPTLRKERGMPKEPRVGRRIAGMGEA